MKGDFLYQSEYKEFYEVTDSILPPLECYRFSPSSKVVNSIGCKTHRKGKC